MADDALANIGIIIWLHGWIIVWPFARWFLRRSPREYRVLFWIFSASIALQTTSFIYLWSLYYAGNRDWFMAWIFPQAIATIAWIASFLTLFNMLLMPAPKAAPNEPQSPVT